MSPSLANQLALFSRELVDLLKTAPHCQLPFNRFIPAYHHHFGRQCRVADYGFTKLIDLLEALTHTVQVRKLNNAISQIYKVLIFETMCINVHFFLGNG